MEIRTKLNDVYEEGLTKEVTIKVSPGGISFRFSGYGDKTSVKGEGEPALVELRNGVPYVVVWGDINQEDPTHVVSLEGAAEVDNSIVVENGK
jgi:hypothetical protein